ncbi:hypothetical protein GM418_06380 [Maribellus comscasis]|uniref:Cycloisomerase n=1 Tax=Maribellus comscasis TaxID=2681766 RepID=A0A6I6JQG9_9BACT|nr:hypothetical protein [Maribellus comscasis]QGY43298.1 hypothetical protein GM418_06380 [Maribellus comscasis]
MLKIEMFLFTILLLAWNISFSQSSKISFETIKTFETKEAHQGIAVDANYFYTINSRGIGKYDKNSGEFISEWTEDSNQIIHFDGGVVINEKLYIAHSNYPGIPMTSSIEIFNKNTLIHIETHSFGIRYGSCTWADFYDNFWWVCFAHYDKFESETNTNSSWTTLVKFDKSWKEKESWIFPENILSEFKPMSCSGGSWGPDGNLYVTGHDSAKVFVLKIPEMGSTLKYVKTIKLEIFGQGIAWDRSDRNHIYGIIRKNNRVVKSKINFK